MTPVVLDRLRDGRDVAAVLRARQQRAGRLVVVHAKRRVSDGVPRVGVVASRRIGNAVSRNRAKRLLREAARHTRWVAGIDVVLVARAPCAQSTLREVHAELERLAGALQLVEDGAERMADAGTSERTGS